MKHTKKWLTLLIALAVVILVSAAAHFATRPQTEKAALSVEVAGEVVSVPLESLPWQPVEGMVINGKQETVTISGQGAALRDILALAKAEEKRISSVTVTADDSYTAQISCEELLSDVGIYLMQEEDSVRLVVFGDKNRKRNVSHVILISVEY